MATTKRKTPAKTGTTRKTTASKRTTTRKTAAKAAAAPKTAKTTPAKPTKSAAVASVEKAAPKPTVVTTTAPTLSAPEMKKKELIDAVVKRSGIKKKDAKPVVEAMLAVLGEQLGDGRELNLQPLGKVKINRIKHLANGRVVMCKLRQSAPSDSPAKDPLADAAE